MREIDASDLLETYPLPEHGSSKDRQSWPTRHMRVAEWVEAGRAWKRFGLEGAAMHVEMSLEEL